MPFLSSSHRFACHTGKALNATVSHVVFFFWGELQAGFVGKGGWLGNVKERSSGPFIAVPAPLWDYYSNLLSK